MGGAAATIAKFVRLVFWPLASALLLVALLQPIYLASLVALDALPQDRIVRHIADGFTQGVIAADGAPKVRIWKGGEQLTECISLGIGLDRTESPRRRAITSAYPMLDDTHACTGLQRLVTGQPVLWRPYFRYWHGYRVILAPLVALIPIWLIKLVNALLAALACYWFWRALRRDADATVATVVLITFIGLSDVLFIWRTSTHAYALAFILAGAAAFATALRSGRTPAALILMSATFGSLFNFIDFLVNPPIMPMLLAFFTLLIGRRNAGLLAFAVVIAWFSGYAETWAAKWAIAYMTMPDSAAVVADVLGTIEVRTVGALHGVMLLPLAATVRCVLRALNRVGVILPALVLVALARYSRTVSPIDWMRVLRLASPALVCVVWFEALSSHTQFHLTVSSRSAAMALALIAGALPLAMQQKPTLRELHAQLHEIWAKLPLIRRAS